MKIGTVGTGVIVEEFLNAVSEVENVNCVAVYSRKQETASNLANKFNIKKTYTDYESLLNDKEIEFIYIALPNSLHYEYTLKALKSGKNVINEKPFTSTIEEAETLIKTAKEKKLFLFEAITIAPDNIPVREIAPINDNSPDKLIASPPPTEPLIPDKANPPPIVHVDVSNTAIN